jgi:hypothetical protein
LDDCNKAHCDPRELWVSSIKTKNPELPTGLRSGGAIAPDFTFLYRLLCLLTPEQFSFEKVSSCGV